MAQATEVRISARALERTLRTQLFTGPDGRFYMKGTTNSPCFVYASDPKVSFRDERIVVHLKTRAKLGTSLHGSCLGVGLSDEAEVSLVPDAEGETIGFRDARIEHISENRELNFLLVPFLKNKLPAQLKVNAADLMRKVLSGSADKTGYALTLSSFEAPLAAPRGKYPCARCRQHPRGGLNPVAPTIHQTSEQSAFLHRMGHTSCKTSGDKAPILVGAALLQSRI